MSDGNMLPLHSHYVLFQLSQSFSLLQCDWLCCFPQSRPLTVLHRITASFKRCSAAIRLQNQQQAQSNNFYRFKQPVTPQTNRPGFCRFFLFFFMCNLPFKQNFTTFTISESDCIARYVYTYQEFDSGVSGHAKRRQGK